MGFVCVCVCACSVYRLPQLLLIPTSESYSRQWKMLFRFRVAWMNWRNSLKEGENNLLGASAKACTEAGITSSINADRAGPAHSVAIPGKRVGGCIRYYLPHYLPYLAVKKKEMPYWDV